MDKKKLLDMIEDDEFGLLDVKPKASGQLTDDERLREAFEDISKFYSKHGREPANNASDINEFKLFSRLAAIRKSAEKSSALADLDKFKLLHARIAPTSVSEILSDDELNILADGSENIFTLKNVPKTVAAPDYVAKRQPCADFASFASLFLECQSDLKTGKRQLLPFAKEQQIEKGLFFVLKGVLLYVAEAAEKKKINKKKNARLRCIFENQTESDLLLRSLARALYKDGRRVSENVGKLLDGFKGISVDDQETGYVYVLRSLSPRPEIKSIGHLFKIGFSRLPVEERIKNAAAEPTYLMAPVSIVATYRCFNINPQKFESLLHTFFGTACLGVKIAGPTGQMHAPREWFIAPFDIIEQAIYFLMNGEIVNYRYDSTRKEIVGRG